MLAKCWLYYVLDVVPQSRFLLLIRTILLNVRNEYVPPTIQIPQTLGEHIISLAMSNETYLAIQIYQSPKGGL